MSETTTDTPPADQETEASADSVPSKSDGFTDALRDSIEAMREHLKPLYESGDLLSFALTNDDGDVLYNESFLSKEGVHKAVATFVSNEKQLTGSGRRLLRMTVEMDDIIVIYRSVEQGQGLFILASDGSIDASVKLIDELASEE